MHQKANVEIYTWDHCPYCQKAIGLLDKKDIKYTRYKIDGDEVAREKMSMRANGKRTVPQIFISDKHIGGCDDIHALEDAGKFDELVFDLK